MGLLRSPKTRAGLIAAVASMGLSRRFVIGWLTAAEQAGRIVALQSSVGGAPLYQAARETHDERLQPSPYPAWLCPSHAPLPPTTGRRVYTTLVDADNAPAPTWSPTRQQENNMNADKSLPSPTQGGAQ